MSLGVTGGRHARRGYIHAVGRRLSIGAALLALAAAGCGGDDGDVTSAGYVPAAGSETPMSTPGVPAGASYDLSASEWLDLEADERLAAAEDYVADNPDGCEGSEGPAAAESVSDYAEATAGTDYPLNAPVNELLAEGCAAALQSGN